MTTASTDFYQYLFDVRGKVALVTGGTRGIGFMIAEGLVKAGARVYVASRKAEACKETEAQLSPHGFASPSPQICRPSMAAELWLKTSILGRTSSIS